jgi:acyl dehydratase
VEVSMRGKTFEELEVGQEFQTGARTITETDVVNFAGISGDYHPEHMNEEFAKKGALGGRIAHGVLILAVATGQMNQTGMLEGTNIAVMETRVRFLLPVRFGDTIRTVVRVSSKRETKKPDRGVVTLEATVLNQTNQTVLEAELVVMVYRMDHVPSWT